MKKYVYIFDFITHFLFALSIFTVKCDFVVWLQVNEIPLTVNKFK